MTTVPSRASGTGSATEYLVAKLVENAPPRVPALPEALEGNRSELLKAGRGR